MELKKRSLTETFLYSSVICKKKKTFFYASRLDSFHVTNLDECYDKGARVDCSPVIIFTTFYVMIFHGELILLL